MFFLSSAAALAYAATHPQRVAGLVLVGAPQEDQPSALHRLAPTVPHRVISGASHWIQMDEPPQLNPMLDEFLARAK